MQTIWVWMVLALALPSLMPGARAEPTPIRVVVVTMFEPGADTGDQPGEFQAWVERFPLPVVLPFPQGYRDLRYNPAKGVLGIVTGVGTARAAASIMALGMDPRFDLSRAYWLVAGIAGADPNNMSLGSAAWAEWLVDGDLAHEIDPREMPRSWTTGYLPLERAKPYALPRPEGFGSVYHLDAGLVGWAYRLTRNTHLADSAALRQARSRFVGFPKARQPPSVIRGDNLGAMTFWHGELLNRWANRWVGYWTEGQGEFATTAQEDTGTAQSLTFLDRAGRADFARLLVLRTASNPTMQYPGITAAERLAAELTGAYSAYLPSLEAAYRVGSSVVGMSPGSHGLVAGTLGRDLEGSFLAHPQGYHGGTPAAARACLAVASARVGRRRERVACLVLDLFQKVGAGGPGGDALEDRGDAV